MPYVPTPYGTPTSNPATEQNSQVSDLAIDMLRRTKGWVRFLSVLGFIGAAFMLLGSFGMFIAGSQINGGFGASLGFIYLAMSILYIYPCIKLWQYATSISNLMLSRSSIDLETALDKQRGFWKFVGIMAIIMLALYILMFLGIALGAASAAF